jgi:YVTN family beta-propeller protein
MEERIRKLSLLAGLILAACTAVIEAGEGRSDYLSPLDLVAEATGQRLYIAEATAKQIAVFELAGEKVARTFPLPKEPTGLVLASDGAHLYVTGSGPKGGVCVLDVESGKVVRTLTAGHTPMAPVLSPDGKRLYVCNRFNDSVSAIDVASGKVAGEIAVLREPVAAAITKDGRFLFVGNLLPRGASDQDYVAAQVSVIDTAANKVVSSIPLTNGSTGVHGICMSPDGRHAYVTHVLARYHLPTTQLERGWINTNAVSVIDVENKSLVNAVLLDDVDLGAANPWGAACSADGKYVCVTHAGTHQLSVIDRAALHDRLAKAAAGEKATEVSSSSEDVPNDLSFLVGIRRRLNLTGNGPRGLVVVGTKVYAAEYFTDSLGVVDIDPQARPRARSVALGPRVAVTSLRKGEMFFHDASLCFQHWQSCASCHPGGARVDGLNWDLLNDGIGNPKNTRSLLLSHRTPPAMSLGAREDAEAAVRAGIRHIQFAARPEEDALAIDEYLKSLKPVASPYRINGRLSEAARRGRTVFKSAGCTSCHDRPLRTDLKQYDLGTGTGLDKDRHFDTPTLIELWRTAPYLHDGRAATIKEVLTKYNPGDKHGETSGLTEQQVEDLAEFILSL